MFLHQRTQIFICRAAFLSLCILPTLGIVGWALWLKQPMRTAILQRRLSEKYGLDFVLSRVVHPRRGLVRVESVQIREPASERLLAALAQVEITRSKSGPLIMAQEVRIDATARDALAQFLQGKLQRPVSEGNLWFSTGELIWHQGSQRWAMPKFRAGLETTAAVQQAFATFQSDKPGKDDPRVRIVHRHDPKQPPYEVQLHTGKSTLPCQLLDALGAPISCLGPRAAFQGSAWSHFIEGSWVTQITGRVSGVDLESLLGQGSPHRLTGEAQIATMPQTPLRLRGNRLERVAAAITAGPGEISGSLLTAAVLHLEMTGSDTIDKARDERNFPYERLAMEVRIDAQGVSIRGQCEEAGVILCDQQGPLLTQSAQPHSVVQLIETLSPATKVAIPASAQAQRLAQHLPLPQLTASRSMGVRVRPNSILR